VISIYRQLSGDTVGTQPELSVKPLDYCTRPEQSSKPRGLMTITLQLFRRFRFCSTRRLLPGVLAALFLAAIGCGHGKIRSTQTRVSPAVASETKGAEAMQAAAGFDKFFLHDDCTAQYPPQPDTCLHDRLHQQSFTFGGKAGTIYDVTLHIRGIFEPTTITSGETPDAQHPYFKVGGTVSTRIGPSGQSRSQNPNRLTG
jgi:hypothetical protein